MLALFAWIGGLALTWGDETVERVHELLAWSLIGLIAVHVIGVVVASRRHRENLVRAMFDGRKRAPADGDIA